MTIRAAVLLAVLCALPVVADPVETKPIIAIIGTGDMGDSLGPRFVELGYKVVYGSRDPDVVGGPVTIPIAADDREAKEEIAKIIIEMGLAPVDNLSHIPETQGEARDCPGTE